MTHQVVLHDADAARWLHFQAPEQVIEIHKLDEVKPGLRQVEALVEQHSWYAAGFISYEAAPAFDPALQVRPPADLPLLWFGLYTRPESSPALPALPRPGYALAGWTPTISQTEYEQAITQIKEHIARGETYQVNYTFRLQTPFSGSPWTLFAELVQAQQADYTGYVDTGRFVVCSASPELFFRLNGDTLISRPMKGTAPRGRTLAEDMSQSFWLHCSEKNRAENVMIVDMIRNDMGRVAIPGTVKVLSLFETERYPTVWQMTSTISATTTAPLHEIMAALFPCASITGAPKPRTMRIIAGLETRPRSIYTGCIGFIAPGRVAQFNVAIRTVLLDQASGRAEYGVGGGIVWDSVGQNEYAECRIKARVLTEKRLDFSLLETILWTPELGYYLLPYHLQRLQDSAIYFNYPVDIEGIQAGLIRLAARLPLQPHRVRLLVTKDGTPTYQASLHNMAADAQPVRLSLAPAPVDSANPFLYHKTTLRQVYEAARAACPDSDDVLLWNERGELTETTIANVVLQLRGELVTPPISCGVLPGTLRAWLLDEAKVRERIIKVDELKESEQIYLVNSVRQWREGYLAG